LPLYRRPKNVKQVADELENLNATSLDLKNYI
jgi:hypothetical protein